MDALTALLDGPRAQRAFLLQVVMGGRWSISVEDGAALTVAVVTRGAATVTMRGRVHELGLGDVLVVRGPEPYVVADAAATPPDIRILPGQVCVDPHGHLLHEAMALGVRRWGNTTDEDAAVMLIGAYEQETSVGAHVLARLPELVIVRDLGSPVVALLGEELARQAPGQEAVLDRLLDLVLVEVLRRAHEEGTVGEEDPVVARALALLHERPDHPWTVATLAAAVGLSRATLARRFAARVGEPPLTYLTRWRITLAADLLTGTGLTLESIAARVGYANAFALSTAFKRAHGVSPAAFRAGGAPRPA